MDLKQLEYFVHVAELGSFTKASSELNVAQPALSRQVRLLEVELRHNLLSRNGRGVSLTEAGQLLLDHGRGILHQVARAREDLGRVRGALAGRVTVGLPPSVSKIMTVPLSREFRQRLPNATLSISEALSYSMKEWLLAGRLDVAVLYNPAPDPELDTVPLAEEDLYLVSRRGEREPGPTVRLKDVAELPLVIPNRPHSLRMLIESHLTAIGCKPRISMEIDGVNAILDLVADGAGHAILPSNAAPASAQPGAFVVTPISEPRVVSRLALATAAGRPTTLTQEAVLELIRNFARSAWPAPPGGER